MKIGCLGDLHNNFDKLAEVTNSDLPVILTVGDLGYYPSEEYLRIVDKEAYKNNAKVTTDAILATITKPVITVPGNHDDLEFIDDNMINGVCTVGNITFLHGAFKQIAEHIWVFGFGKIYVPGTYYNLEKEYLVGFGIRNGRKAIHSITKKRGHFNKEEVSLAYANILEFNKTRNWKDTVIFISHDIPKNYVEKIRAEVGSSMIEFMYALLNPDYTFFGHYHTHAEFPEGTVLNKEELVVLDIE